MAYLMAEQPSEIERLRFQSRVWEPAGQRLLDQLGDGRGYRALEIGCGPMGWLPILSRWVGAEGEVVGIDVDDRMLGAARDLCVEAALANTTVAQDDVFASALPNARFDLVHLRFQLAPIGRVSEQLATARRVLRPGGWFVLEDPDMGSWREHPAAPSADRLRTLIEESFMRAGGDFNAGRRLPEYLRRLGVEPTVRAECLALEPGHPYLQLPLQFATALRPRLLAIVSEHELDRLVARAWEEIAAPERWGTSFTLIQAWGRAPEA
jgi:SAM-dependent methyltransferase